MIILRSLVLTYSKRREKCLFRLFFENRIKQLLHESFTAGKGSIIFFMLHFHFKER